MKQQRISHRAGRRQFFKKAAFLGGTAVMAVLRGRARAKPLPEMPNRPRGRGYRLTPHIRKYYEKASL